MSGVKDGCSVHNGGLVGWGRGGGGGGGAMAGAENEMLVGTKQVRV